MLAPFRTQDGGSLSPLVDDFMKRGWVTGGDEFEFTEQGSATHRRLAGVIKTQRARITEGISDEEYLATVDVLRAHGLEPGVAHRE